MSELKWLILLALLLPVPAYAGDITGVVSAKVHGSLNRKSNESAEARKKQNALYGKAAMKKRIPGSEKDGGLTKKELSELNELDYVVVFLSEKGQGKNLPTSKSRVVLSQRGRVFREHVTPVVQNAVVVFTNEDKFEHDIYTPRKSTFKVGPHGRGAARERVAEGLGAHEIFCNIHTLMNAYIYVVPNDFFTMASGGKFTLKNVPPGTYELKAWHPRLGEASQTVTVGAGVETVNLSL